MKPIFLLFIYYGMYSRFSGFIGFTGGQTTVLMAFALFCMAVFHKIFVRKNFTMSGFMVFICLFFVLSGVLPLLSAFVFPSPPGRILRFSVEIAVTFFIFFSVYYFVKEKMISPKFFIYSLAVLGLITSLQLLGSIFQQVRVQRLRGLSGSNYLGNSLAMGAFAWILIIYWNARKDTHKVKKIAIYFSFILTMLALFLTGTRAALISLIAGVFLFQFFGMKSKNFTKYSFYVILGIAVFLVIIAFNIDLTLLFRRFTWAEITRMANLRFSIYALAVTELTLPDFLFGRPDLYIFSNADDFHNTHNMFLSIIRYNGVLLFVMSIFMYVAIFYKYLGLYALHKKQDKYRVIESSTIVLLVMVMIYTMFSGGRITRSFSLFVAMGFAVGYFDMFRNLKSYDEYKKLIF